MKALFGVDRLAKVIHSVGATAANVHDSAVLGDLLHGEERDLWGDPAYQGQSEVIKEKAPKLATYQPALSAPLCGECG